MTQPTLIHIPGILLRTTLRLLARLIFFLASGALLLGAALVLVSLLLATWRAPRTRKWQLATDVVLLVTELAKERLSVTHTDSPDD